MSNEEEKKCPACGEYMPSGIRVGSYILCHKCCSEGTTDIALKIAKSKHKERLEKIWAELEKED